MRVIAFFVSTVILLEIVASRRIRQKATRIVVNPNLATPYFDCCQSLPFPPDFLSPYDNCECEPCIDEEDYECEPLSASLPCFDKFDRCQCRRFPPFLPRFDRCQCQPFPPPCFDNCERQRFPPYFRPYEFDRCQCQKFPPNCLSKELILPPLKPELPDGLGYLPGAVPLLQSYLERGDRCGECNCVERCRVPVCDSCFVLAAPLCTEMAPMPRPIIL